MLHSVNQQHKRGQCDEEWSIRAGAKRNCRLMFSRADIWVRTKCENLRPRCSQKGRATQMSLGGRWETESQNGCASYGHSSVKPGWSLEDSESLFRHMKDFCLLFLVQERKTNCNPHYEGHNNISGICFVEGQAWEGRSDQFRCHDIINQGEGDLDCGKDWEEDNKEGRLHTIWR